jgi:hypothetical protein
MSGVVNTTTQAAVTGQIVWLAPTQTLSVALAASTAVATTTQAAVTGAVVWLAPTQTISLTATVTATVTTTITGTVTVTNTGSVGVSGSVGISGSVLVSGTISASGIVLTTTQAAVTGQLVWLAPTQTVTVAISSVVMTTGVPSVNATGLVVMVGTGDISVFDVARTQVVIVVTTTIPPAALTTLLFTVYTGVTQAAAATTAWVIPAGKTLRINSVQAVVGTSAVATFNTIAVLVSTAQPTNVAAAPIAANAFINVNAAVVSGGIIGLAQDIAAGITIAFGVSATTKSILNAASIVGYLFP